MANGDFAPGFGFDDTPPPHHKKWDKALQDAVDKATAEWSRGDTGKFDVKFVVSVTKLNPGWVDGYKIVLTPTDD
jgi:hypothetical protein